MEPRISNGDGNYVPAVRLIFPGADIRPTAQNDAVIVTPAGGGGPGGAPISHASTHAVGGDDEITIVASQVSNFAEAVDDRVGALVVDSSTIDATYDDGGNLLTLDVIPGGISITDLDAGGTNAVVIAGLGGTPERIANGGAGTVFKGGTPGGGATGMGFAQIFNADVAAAAGIAASKLSGLAAIATSGSATDLTSGTVSDSRLSTNVALENVANVFTAQQTIRKTAVMAVFDTGAASDGRWEFQFNSSRIGFFNMASATSLRLATDAGVDLVLYAGNVTSTVPRLTLKENGDVVIGDAALATGATAKFLWIPTCAGTPTGVPAGSYAGRVPILFDTTGNKIWIYDGAWLSTVALT